MLAAAKKQPVVMYAMKIRGLDVQFYRAYFPLNYLATIDAGYVPPDPAVHILGFDRVLHLVDVRDRTSPC